MMNNLIPKFVDMNWTSLKDRLGLQFAPTLHLKSFLNKGDPRLGKLGCVDVDEKVVSCAVFFCWGKIPQCRGPS